MGDPGLEIRVVAPEYPVHQDTGVYWECADEPLRSDILCLYMIRSIEEIKVLDPACGSGHFLTAMLSEILRVRESLLRTIGEEIDRYKIKQEIISRNPFGVDIDRNAVEIARLRLWLSIIEEAEDPKLIDTLPNIDFNILVGIHKKYVCQNASERGTCTILYLCSS